MDNWKAFWFEGNLAWGHIKSREDWERIKHAYKDSSIDLLDAKISMYKRRITPQSFGFYSEHKGNETLRDFAKENNMDLS